MVKKITKYKCEFPECNKEYTSIEQAKRCESQGIIGPDIKPGFTLRGSESYLIVLGTYQNVHEKKYSFIIIRNSLDDLKTCESSSELSISSAKEQISSLESLIKKGEIRLLNNKEFRQLSKIINNSKCMIGVRSVLKDEGMKKLYRIHSYFKHMPWIS